MNQKKRALLVMPLLVIPFLTMAFWALGGGQGDGKKEEQSSGLNLQLPNAKLKDDRAENKLSFYEEAERDSLKAEEKIKSDPFFRMNEKKDSSWTVPSRPSSFDPAPVRSDYKDPNEEKVYAKLRQLQAQLGSTPSKKEVVPTNFVSDTRIHPDDVSRLENLLKRGDTDTRGDPQIKELNQMMDKILDIQHPERVRERIIEKAPQIAQDYFPVENKTIPYSVGLMDTGSATDRADAFFGTDVKGHDQRDNSIEAVIHETQMVLDGSIVKLRLLSDVSISGATVIRGSFVFGTASLRGERLHIEIRSLRSGSSIFPVKLVVYDLDGMEGIHIPGAISRDVAKQSAENSISNLEMASLDPSLKAQATTAGINAAKSLLTKKAKLVKVAVKGGYKVFLR